MKPNTIYKTFVGSGKHKTDFIVLTPLIIPEAEGAEIATTILRSKGSYNHDRIREGKLDMYRGWECEEIGKPENHPEYFL